ncbi:glycosyltransferase family 1 protein [Roseomonas sp. SSH11]|uniref:Glycosyltransferase family 1 protein n=1 Tax=Pararoseomonas baculiformis TaxID=2820812 RepID=A0ABS4AIL4_9PROT|nr:glycosyltransferase [Pararoseomonas baculiformis]MBP0446365.1 glycosyltransferase family 1 protein [Pararoseomonas baculiformis]
MRVSLHALGTRGDVQPCIALALGLMRRGHAVQLAAPAQFERMAAARGVPFAPLPGEFLALLDTPEGKAAIAGSKGFGAGLKLLKPLRPLMRRLLDAEWEAARAFAPDLILHHPKCIGAPAMAGRLGCAHILASPLPGFTPTAAFPSPLLPFASLGPLNRLSHWLAIRGAQSLFARLLRAWRAEQLGGAAPRPSAGTLYAYSRHILPLPDDWGEDVCVTGNWFLDEPAWRPPEALAAFLQAGPPPVYIGFGSMPGLDPARLTAIIAEALSRTGRRGLLARGGGAIGAAALPPGIMAIDEAPHDQLLPLVHAVIHHGGAGTTAAALRAGKPCAILPFFGDQPFWARRITGLGVGPPTLDRRTLSAESLATAIAALDAPPMRARAASLGARIRAEDGIAAALAFIEKRMRRAG